MFKLRVKEKWANHNAETQVKGTYTVSFATDDNSIEMLYLHNVKVVSFDKQLFVQYPVFDDIHGVSAPATKYIEKTKNRNIVNFSSELRAKIDKAVLDCYYDNCRRHFKLKNKAS